MQPTKKKPATKKSNSSGSKKTNINKNPRDFDIVNNFHLVLNVSNFAREEKEISLLNNPLNDRFINIESAISIISYEEICRAINSGNFKLNGVYAQIISGSLNNSLPNLNMRCIQKNISPASLEEPLHFVIDPFQGQTNVVFSSLEKRNILLNSLSSLILKLPSKTDIQLRLFITPTTQKISF